MRLMKRLAGAWDHMGIRATYAMIGVLLGCAVTGCGPDAGTSTSGEVRPNARPTERTIGVVLPTFAHPFFAAQKRGLEAEAAVFDGIFLSLDVRDGKDDDRTQIEQIENLITLGVDLMIVCPRDQGAIRRALDSAERAQIRVIALNRRVKRGRIVAYVGADDREAGRVQARALVEAVGEKPARVLYLHGTQGSSPQIERYAGFTEVTRSHPNIEIAEDRFCDFQADKAKADLVVLAQRYKPGELGAIVAQNDEMALAAAEVARGEGWNEVVVIGCDGTRQAFEAVRLGLMHATVLQDAAEQGRLSVRTARRMLRGEETPAEVITPLPIVTRANVDSLKPSY
jgi:ABC-type sugar transport system substrate-binding protein